ncbi:phosphocholine-specific phospholipase C [Massilia sp. CF038]|uniref:phosphocholine-specific phospholipase C n=1 Tax=Massilia sp. CF038 TaxID=1881045 RepID=UPI0009116F60|nr:phospholipase C, phosphocholine-specific [Massilia sp. CF038]SHG35848.1 phospholipase C [Massilia sp. CF038]
MASVREAGEQDGAASDGATGTIMDVAHIVILMQENRSFDHYFGTLKGVRGFGDRFPIPHPQSDSVWFQRDGETVVTPFHLDTQQAFERLRVASTPHTWPDAQLAWNHGILDQWPTYKRAHSMGYFTEADIPFQFALANMFTVCDAYHAAFLGGTNPNRVFTWSGGNDPHAAAHGPVIGNSYDNLAFDPQGGYAWTTYPERLQEAGISWQVYQDMADNYADNPLAGFRQFRAAMADPASPLRLRGMSTRTLAQLQHDVEQNALPQVSYIIATAEGSEHPVPSSPAQGAHYTAQVLAALNANPDVWRKTVLFLVYDENDGFFDHVPPPAPPSVLGWQGEPPQPVFAGASSVDTAADYHRHATLEATESPALMQRPYGLGPRVPMVVVSPWSRGGWVSSEVFDHTSLIRFMERRFGVMEPNITPWRRAVCGDLTSAFDFSRSDAAPFLDQLPATGARAAQARTLGATAPMPPALALPRQAAGVRRSRALPYQLHVSDHVDVGAMTLTLQLASSGSGAAVFHIYDRLAPEALPRRYTVGPGTQLSGSWALAGQGGAYDLWVLGPGGFHRQFAGRAGASLPASIDEPEVRVLYDGAEGSLDAELFNPGLMPLTFVITTNAYGDSAPVELVVAPYATNVHMWNLHQSGHWYDVSVRVRELPAFVRRFAGRVETGRDGISDPAIGR